MTDAKGQEIESRSSEARGEPGDSWIFTMTVGGKPRRVVFDAVTKVDTREVPFALQDILLP